MEGAFLAVFRAEDQWVKCSKQCPGAHLNPRLKLVIHTVWIWAKFELETGFRLTFEGCRDVSKGRIKPQKECGRARRLAQVLLVFLIGFIVPYYLFSLKISFINVTTQENYSHLWQQHTALIPSEQAEKYSRDIWLCFSILRVKMFTAGRSRQQRISTVTGRSQALSCAL